jgi:hypothetical protein
LAFDGGDLGGTKHASQFRFLNRRADDRDSGGGGGEFAVDERGIVGAAKVMEVAAHAASVLARQVRGNRHEHEAHAGGPKDFGAVAVGGEVAEKAVEVAHGVLGSGGLGAGESTRGGENPAVHTSPIVQHVPYGDLELELLSGGGWGGDIVSCRLRQLRVVRRRSVDGRGGGRFDAEWAEAEKEGIDIAGVREADGSSGAVMMNGEAKKFGGNRVRLDMVEGG